MPDSRTQPANGPWFLADHPALDFINTTAQIDGHEHDFWQSDDDVEAWLNQAGLRVAPETEPPAEPGALLQEARRLRNIIKQVVVQKKRGTQVDTQGINHYLVAAATHDELVNAADGALQIKRIYANRTPLQRLAPVAEQAASLLAEHNFALVRECEHPECSLWFYDRTKAHRRRWCSMALCGNRAKVSRFRQQKK
ncbi:CGNR zinc finger domain-containing protein [Pantoea sp. B65]|uniref:CGNR zinc finger domain-containing protein n=1 Tax=Pantoea sp. B65 TaxID=2813359 RepID=UPI0039B4274B